MKHTSILFAITVLTLITKASSTQHVPIKPILYENNLHFSFNDFFILLDNTLEYMGAYEYFPKTQNLLNTISSHLPEIQSLISKIKTASKDELLPILLEAFIELSDVFTAVNGVPAEIKTNISNIISLFKTKAYWTSLFENLKTRIAELASIAISAKQVCEYGIYSQCGKNIGFALAIIFNIK